MKNATERIKNLREYYLNNSPMALDRSLVAWHCHRSLYYYVEGWIEGRWAETLRLRRAKAEAYLLRHIEPVIERGELIVGQPDFRPFDEEEQANFKKYEELYWKLMPQKKGRMDHLAPDFSLLLEKGVCGMIEMLDERLSEIDIFDGSQIERWEYYTACKTELEGLCDLAERYEKKARELAEKAEGTEKKELLELALVLARVPRYGARSFREALQSVHLFKFSLFGLYSCGHIDRWLLPYYRNDIEKGIITPDEAQELIDCFFLMSIPNMSAWAAEGLMLGGRLSDGSVVENELTKHFLIAIEHTHIPDPNVGMCVTHDTSDEMYRLVARLIKAGHAQPQIWNSDAVTESMLSYGFDMEAANNFTLSTCVEVTPVGKSGISITSPYMNLLKVFLLSLEKMPSQTDLEGAYAVFAKEFKDFARREMLTEHLYQLERGRNYTDPARVSLLIHDCIERGKSHDCGGALYNIMEPNVFGMSNVIECFNVLNELVFKSGAYSLEVIREAIKNNFEGHGELLARIRNGVVHFGNDTDEASLIAKRVSDIVLDTFKEQRTVRGAAVIPGSFSYRDHIMHGQQTGASPDGRLANKPLNDGSCPVQGYDISGPTATLKSIAAWEPARFLGGSSVNVKLSRSVKEEDIIGLIKGYLTTKGSQLQFNICDKDELLDAKLNPEDHGDLLVRIGGYSDFFVKLTPELQDEVISRTQNEF